MQIKAQSFRFELFQGIAVLQNGAKLTNPWAGGMNAMQYQSMDLNGDKVLDVVCFDRTSQQLATFIQSTAGHFLYNPTYIPSFPRIENWFVLVDFNQDGLKDLFSATGAGVKVYQAKFAEGKLQFELVKDPLYTLGFSGLINLYVAAPDIPVVADVDSDGDVDVLAFEPGGHYIEFHENVSMQRSGVAGLQFEKSPTIWGGIQHRNCFDISLNSLESQLSSQSIGEKGSVLHVGNALGRDASNNLYFGQVSCSNLSFLKNEGLGNQVKYAQINYDWLAGYQLPAGIFWSAFPLSLAENKEDLLISVNTSDNVGYIQDFQHSSFRISDGKAMPFLQDQMIDVGEKASPCFFDVDRDGDLDLLIGGRGNGKSAGLAYYENQLGSLDYKTSDYLGLASRESWSDVVVQSMGENILLTAQGSSGPVANILKDQQLSPYRIDLGAGEVPIVSPWGIMIHRRSGRIQLGDNLDWGMLSKESWQLRSGQVGDLNGDGMSEFIAIDVDGLWHIGNYDTDSNRIIWQETQLSLPFMGRNTRLQLADVTGDGRLDLVVGTGGGGVQCLANKSISPVWDSMDSHALQVWPNPSSGTIFVLTGRSGELQTFNALGQEINCMLLQAGKTYQINDSKIQLIRFTDSTGKSNTRKIQHD